MVINVGQLNSLIGINKHPSKVGQDNVQKTDSNFKNILTNELNAIKEDSSLTLTGHAMKRMKERNITLSQSELEDLNSAVTKLKSKGSKESLLLMNDLGFIVNVNKGSIITAMDKNELKDRVFTNIDSTVIV